MSVDILSLIDLTSLNETDNAATTAALCKKALTDHGHVAAVCLYPSWVKQAKSLLANTPIKIATVANFPQGTDPLQQVLDVIQQAIQAGADEIDVVFPYPDYLAGNQTTAFDFIRACKNLCGKTILLKVILETGALTDLTRIAHISDMLCLPGYADFLKTSTGKIAIGATLPAARAILTSIQKASRPVGLKVSGGVRTIDQAMQYISLATEIMGSDWVNPRHFRIGASQLVG